MKTVETGDRKVGEFGEEDPDERSKRRKVWKFVRIGQEKYRKPEQDAMLAGAGEDEFIKCFDDITGKQMPCML